jgi:hypothetical protein
MTEEQKDFQIQDAIRDYAKAKETLACLKKKLKDFQDAAVMANNALSFGVDPIRIEPSSKLLNASELAETVKEYNSTLERIADLGSYLKAVGYGGLVS